jgi:hypothetical protein
MIARYPAQRSLPMPDPTHHDSPESEAIADILINETETVTRRPARVDGTDQPPVGEEEDTARR